MNDSGKNELAHYGIIGMKWGVRRQVGSDGRVGTSPKSKDDIVKDKRRADVKNRRLLSDDDLIKKIARLEREKKLRELTDTEINEGKKTTNEILKSVGVKVATSVLTGATLYGIKSVISGNINIADLASYVAPKPKK